MDPEMELEMDPEFEPEYGPEPRPVSIDFDEASKAWRQNKLRRRNSFMIYCCGKIRSNGKKCRNKVSMPMCPTPGPIRCKYHSTPGYAPGYGDPNDRL